MNNTKKSSSVEGIIVVFNMLSYRLDALLSNLIDGLIIASYIVIFQSILKSKFIYLSIIINVIYVSLIQHYIYLIVYIVNDSLDYGNRERAGKVLNDSFYMLRPIFFYKGSSLIILYFGALYATILAYLALYTDIPWTMISIYVALFTITSITHSVLHGYHRVVSFAILRTLRYTLLISLIYFLLNEGADIISITMITSTMVIPYVIYSVKNYAKTIQHRKMIVERQVILFLILASIALMTGLKYMGYMPTLRHIISASISWTLTIGPAVVIRKFLRIMLGKENPSICCHLARLIIGFFLIVLSVLLAFSITNIFVGKITV